MSFLVPVRPADADVADIVVPNLSRRQIIETGKALRGEIRDDRDSIAEAQEIFRIANVWRGAHQVPLRHIRSAISGTIAREGLTGLTAGRLKRMRSIRAKLATGKTDFLSMQDIGGCRAIVDTIEGARSLVAALPDRLRHELKRPTDYILEPKRDGYRCSHLIFRYQGIGAFADLNAKPLLIEVQVRTQLQHAWATAVETVDAFVGENLKAGGGNEHWRRFFALASAEMAAAEGMPGVPGTPSSPAERRDELEHLDAKLGAIDSLDHLRKAVRAVTNVQQRSSPAYIVSLSAADRTVDVTPVSSGDTARAYHTAEQASRRNSVLVEIDRAEDLRAAYPNYYLDAGAFVDFMRGTIRPVDPSLNGPLDLKRMMASGAWRKRGARKPRE